jgi:hypothetical protein
MARPVIPTSDQITPIILDRSIPAFINDYYPQFVAFLQAYYEFLEQSMQPYEIIQHLREYRDIDLTIDSFVEYFRREVMIDIPASVMADKRLLAKNIKAFYQNKGNQASYRFLFRILYNEDIDFYYPKTDILRASDGKWSQTISIKILQAGVPSTGFMFTSKVTGATSMAYATVQSVNILEERGVALYELILSSVYGRFLPGEVLNFSNAPQSLGQILVEDVYAGIDITNGGTAYSINDPIYLRDNHNNIIATGIVTQIGRGPCSGITLVDGGVGYSGLLRDIENFAYLPLNTMYESTILDNTVLNNGHLITTDSDGDVIASQTIWLPITPITITDVGDVILITDTPAPIGQGASGIVTHVTQEGQILDIQLLTDGKDYSIPTAQVDSPEGGTGAVITVQGGGGSIQDTSLLGFPITVGADSNDTVTVDFSAGTGVGATGVPAGNAGTIVYPGYYLNSDGQLSSTKKLQDNYFYQDYSYVILSGLTYTYWADAIDKAIHPAGLKAFGKLKFTVRGENGPDFVSATATQTVTPI